MGPECSPPSIPAASYVSKPDAQKKKNESKPNQILVTTNFGNDKFRQSQTQGKKIKRSIGIRPPSSGDDIVDLV